MCISTGSMYIKPTYGTALLFGVWDLLYTIYIKLLHGIPAQAIEVSFDVRIGGHQIQRKSAVRPPQADGCAKKHYKSLVKTSGICGGDVYNKREFAYNAELRIEREVLWTICEIK